MWIIFEYMSIFEVLRPRMNPWVEDTDTATVELRLMEEASNSLSWVWILVPVLPGSKVTELCGTLRGGPGLPCGSVVKNSPIVQETRVQSLGQEDPLEQEMATHSSISCLENPMDWGAWWTTVHEVAKSQTWLSNWAPRGDQYWRNRKNSPGVVVLMIGAIVLLAPGRFHLLVFALLWHFLLHPKLMEDL